MKKITFMLALFMASLCSVTAWAAEREMPTAPATTLTSGGKYYLYNVDAGLFHAGIGTLSLQPDTLFVVQNTNNNLWALCAWQSVGETMRAIGHETYTYSLNIGDGYPNLAYIQNNPGFSSRWVLEPVTDEANIYRIQITSRYSDVYNKDYYWGVVDNKIQTDQTIDKQVNWRFIPANAESDRYVAEINFYNALTQMEKNGITLEYYDSIYNNRVNFSINEIENFTNEVLSAQTLSAGYKPQWWNDGGQITFTSPDAYINNEYINYVWQPVRYPGWGWSNGALKKDQKNSPNEGTLNAFFCVKEKSALLFTYDHYYNEEFSGHLDVFLDGKKVETTRNLFTDLEYVIQVDSGKHVITWKYANIPQLSFNNFGLTSRYEISVNLKEPGSLGTEVLYHTDHIKNVVCLKVSGEMNDDDWAKLKMMSRLQSLDLSEAIFTEIPEKQFSYKTSNSDTTARFLHELKLPEGLKTIGRSAFEGSLINTLDIPSTTDYIRANAFKGSYITELSFPDDTKFEYVSTLYGNTTTIFGSMPKLHKLALPKNMTEIQEYLCSNCKNLTDVIWPDSLTKIGECAFHNCYSLKNFYVGDSSTLQGELVLPHVTDIGYMGFYGCNQLVKVDLPAAKTIASSAFGKCSKLTDASLGANVHTLDGYVFDNLLTLKLYSPTTVKYGNNYPFKNGIANCTLQVPNYLVNSYKLDDYWYNAKIEGFDYSDMTYIPIRQNLTLNSERFGGKPAIVIFGGAYLKINGNDAQAFQNMKFNVNPGENLYGQLLNNSNTVTQEGVLKLDYYTKAKKWYFITLPFDLDIAKITHDVAGTQYAIRSYDGATRAINGATGNWKNIDRTTTIPAGTGFIFQTNVDTWSTFFAAEGSENLAISTDEFEKTLEVNASTENSHKGWNLVGNPYQCFYNNHMLNFTAPITVWDVDKKTYAAYSITDDDYALRPNEAFFIQCPNEENNTISFPLQGRQLSSVINSQNAVKANGAAVRKLIDLTLSQNGMEDKTRVVFNDNASMAYETGCDAGKFMSMEADVPQVYTLDAQANTYAINERPFGDGIVQLGIYVAKEGTYTFSAQRNSVGNIYLVDNKEGVIINLHDQDYTFQSEAGTIEGRFSLCLNANGMATGIQDMQEDTTEGADLYDLSGRRISQTQKGVYVIRKAGKSEKVMVK